jgi:excisionase family DNA binding protein
MDRLLRFKDAAAQTATSEAFWRKLAARREIPVVKLGRAVRIREADLTRFLADRQREARGAVR